MGSETLVVIPAPNERENLAQILQRLLALLEVPVGVVVDDNSPDGSGEIADDFAARDCRIKVLHRQSKEGLGRAYCAGFLWALEREYEFIFEMDGDLSHNPSDIPAFLVAAKTADLVV